MSLTYTVLEMFSKFLDFLFGTQNFFVLPKVCLPKIFFVCCWCLHFNTIGYHDGNDSEASASSRRGGRGSFRGGRGGGLGSPS